MSASTVPPRRAAVRPQKDAPILPRMKRPRARPRIEIDRVQLLRLGRLGMTVEQAAPLLGMARRTLFERLESPELYAIWMQGQAQAIERATRTIQEAIERGDPRATMFFLARKAGWGVRRTAAPTPPE